MRGQEEKLAWTADAIKVFGRELLIEPFAVTPPPAIECTDVPGGAVIAIDTEGLPSDPICLTWATDGIRAIVAPEDVPEFWQSVTANAKQVIYHNALWDWQVMEAMGVKQPWSVTFEDTMEKGYLRQAEPQGLKDLAWRHLRFKQPKWEEVVCPYYDAKVTVEAAKRIAAGTTAVTISPKTGRAYKKPKLTLTDEAKALKRALANPDLLAKRMKWPEPTLRDVPEDVMIEYATADAWATLLVWEALR